MPMSINDQELLEIASNQRKEPVLDLTECELTLVGLKKLVEALNQNVHIATLNLSRIQLTQEMVLALCNLKNISTLILRECGLSGITIEPLLCIPCVRDLDLAKNKIGPEIAETLHGKQPTLTRLDLSGNPIGSVGVGKKQETSPLSALFAKENKEVKKFELVIPPGTIPLPYKQPHPELADNLKQLRESVHLGHHPEAKKQFIALLQNYMKDPDTFGAKSWFAEACIYYMQICLQGRLTKEEDAKEEKAIDRVLSLDALQQHVEKDSLTLFFDLVEWVRHLMKLEPTTMTQNLFDITQVYLAIREYQLSHWSQAKLWLQGLWETDKVPEALPTANRAVHPAFYYLRFNEHRRVLAEEQMLALIKKGLDGTLEQIELSEVGTAAPLEEKGVEFDFSKETLDSFTIACRLIKHCIVPDANLSTKLGLDLLWLKLVHCAPDSMESPLYASVEGLEIIQQEALLALANAAWLKGHKYPAIELLNRLLDLMIKTRTSVHIHSGAMLHYLNSNRYAGNLKEMELAQKWFAKSTLNQKNPVLKMQLTLQRVRAERAAERFDVAEQLCGSLLAESTKSKLLMAFEDAECNHELGMIKQLKKEYEQALGYFQLSLNARVDVFQDRTAASDAIYSAALVLQQVNQYASAANFYQKCININLASGDISGQGDAHLRLGQMLFRQYRDNNKKQEALQLRDKTEDLWHKAYRAFSAGVYFAECEEDKKSLGVLFKELGDCWYERMQLCDVKNPERNMMSRLMLACYEAAMPLLAKYNLKELYEASANRIAHAYHLAGDEFNSQWWRQRITAFAPPEFLPKIGLSLNAVPVLESEQATQKDHLVGDLRQLAVFSELSNSRLFVLFDALLRNTEKTKQSAIALLFIRRLIDQSTRADGQTVESLLEPFLKEYTEAQALFEDAENYQKNAGEGKVTLASLPASLRPMDVINQLCHWIAKTDSEVENKKQEKQSFAEAELEKQLTAASFTEKGDAWHCEVCKVKLINAKEACRATKTFEHLKDLLNKLHDTTCDKFDERLPTPKAYQRFFDVIKNQLFAMYDAKHTAQEILSNTKSLNTWFEICCQLFENVKDMPLVLDIANVLRIFNMMKRTCRVLMFSVDHHVGRLLLGETPVRSALLEDSITAGGLLSYQFDSKAVRLMSDLFASAQLVGKKSPYLLQRFDEFKKALPGAIQMLQTGAKAELVAWRESMQYGVAWPHSLEMRTAFEQAGFVYRPMLIKRDRMVCDCCYKNTPEDKKKEVGVFGIMPWMDPYMMHVCPYELTLQKPTQVMTIKFVSASKPTMKLEIPAQQVQLSQQGMFSEQLQQGESKQENDPSSVVTIKSPALSLGKTD